MHFSSLSLAAVAVAVNTVAARHHHHAPSNTSVLEVQSNHYAHHVPGKASVFEANSNHSAQHVPEKASVFEVQSNQSTHQQAPSNFSILEAPSNTSIFAVPSNHSSALFPSNTSTSQPISIAYYPTWNPDQVANVNLSFYTHVNIAFAIPQKDGTMVLENESIMDDLIPKLHEEDINVIISVGGWSGSANFSGLVADADKSTAFIKSITDMMQKYDLDGVDIDWEYPGAAGDTCNVFDAENDVPNFFQFLTKLRAQLDSIWDSKNKTISLAMPVRPWNISSNSGVQIADFLNPVSWISLMTYDINGAWENTTGPNAPFNFEDGKGAAASFVSATKAWNDAGWPFNKMCAGLPFYGRSTMALEDMNQDPNNQYQQQNTTAIQGDKDDLPSFDACAGTTAVSGTWRYNNIRGQGLLSDAGTAAEPWVRHWDNTSSTPWLFNSETNTYLTYDDPESLKIKVSYAVNKGLLGVMQWTPDMDYENELNDAIRNALNQ